MMRRLPSGRLFGIALPISLLLLAAVIRFGGLARDQRFHPDEALYATLARQIGLWGDWRLQGVNNDKPPLVFFSNGFFYRILDESEFSTRLPNAFASLIALGLLYRLALRLTRRRTAAGIALGLGTLSPMHIVLGVSGFLDSQLLMWLLACAVLLVEGRWGWSGLAFGLAVASKQTALLTLPLWLAMGMALAPQWPEWRRWIVGGGSIMLLITLWGEVSGIQNFWVGADKNYNTFRLIRSDEVLSRAQTWGEGLHYLLPHPALLLVGLVLGVYFLVHRLHQPTRRDVILWAMFGFSLAYLVLHWLLAIKLVPRYLVLILPWSGVLIGVGSEAVLRRVSLPPLLAVAGAVALVIVSLPPAWDAAQGQIPIANDAGQHAGIDELATVMNQQYGGEIFYEHWLGWELRYYLTADPQVILLYFSTADALVDYALEELPRIQVPRYFVAPKAEAPPWVAVFQRRGLESTMVYDDGKYVIYRLEV